MVGTALTTRLTTLLTTLLLCVLGCTPAPDGPEGKPPWPEEPRVLVAENAPVPNEDDAPPALALELPPEATEDRDEGLTLLHAPLLAMPSGRSAEVFLDLPPGIESVVLLASAHESTHVILEHAKGPEGDVLVSDREPDGLSSPELAVARGFPAQFFSDNRVVAAREVAAFLLPNTPDVPFGPGRYTLRFSTWSVRQEDGAWRKIALERPLRVAVLVKPRRNERARDGNLGRLALTLHLTGAAGLTAESAPDDEGLQLALGVVREAFGRVGIALDEISYVDVEAPGFTTLVLGDGCEGGDIDELLKARTREAAGISVFVVERFQCLTSGGLDVGQGIGGISAGLPGPPWLRGSPRSGLVLATAPFAGEIRRLGVVLAHELAHFLGLYHTKENDLFGGPAIYDRISDTPDDERAAENLMYFRALDDTTLSDGQAAVLRASPWVLP